MEIKECNCMESPDTDIGNHIIICDVCGNEKDILNLNYKKMKYFEIYQVFVGNFDKEENLIVGKESANDSNEALKQYLEKEHPGDLKRQDFVKGYLQTIEVSKERFESNTDDDIDDNRKRIARWL